MGIMKQLNILILAVLVSFSCFVACNDKDSKDQAAAVPVNPPDPYVSFKATGGTVTYDSDGKWICGFNDLENGDKPFTTRVAPKTHCLGLYTNAITTSFDKNSINYVYIILDGTILGEYPEGNCAIKMMFLGINSDKAFTLTKQSVTLTAYSDVYMEGSFEGIDPEGNTVKGNFVFNNIGANKWPAIDI